MTDLVSDRILDKLGRDGWAYRESRARGEGVKFAMHRVRTERTCRDVLSRIDSLPDHVAPKAYDEPVDIYEVDVAALYRHTNGPSPSVRMADGSPVDGTVDLVTDEASAWIVVYYDESGRSHMDEDECYDEADRESWRNNEWLFVGVQAIVSLPDGRIGTSAVWGVEQGSYWPGSDESQIWHVVPDQLSESLDDAKRQKVPPQSFDFTITDESSGVTYQPWTDGHAVGFRATHPDGRVEYLLLNPTSDSDNGEPNIFLYHGGGPSIHDEGEWIILIHMFDEPTEPESKED